MNNLINVIKEAYQNEGRLGIQEFPNKERYLINIEHKDYAFLYIANVKNGILGISDIIINRGSDASKKKILESIITKNEGIARKIDSDKININVHESYKEFLEELGYDTEPTHRIYKGVKRL